jgi:hypothetical protein
MVSPSFHDQATTIRSSVLAFLLLPVLAAQEPSTPKPAQGAAHKVDHRIDPLLLADGQQLAATGLVREGNRVATNLRVVIELAQQPGDVTFETSTAVDRLSDVRAAVIHRQSLFLENLDRALAPAQRAAIQILFPLELQYMLAAEVADLGALRALAAVPGVEWVWKDNLNVLFTSEGRTLTGSAAAETAGFTGAGIGVAVLDTHFDLMHPELGGSTTLPNPVVKGGDNFSNPGGAIHSLAFGDCFHGTAVASIVRRYAPACHLYTLVVFPNSYDSNIANAINWCVVNKAGTGGGYPIKVINMSLGGGQHHAPITSGTLHAACGTALANGILCVAASGNNGYTNALALPAASTNCISVGATWDANDCNYTPFEPAWCNDPDRFVDERTCYSNKTDFLSFYCPSEAVVCAQCGGGTMELGGTSSASPAAAGMIAQLLHAYPHYEGTRDAIINLFHDTGAPVIGDVNRRRVNLTAALANAAPPTGRTMVTLAPPILGQTMSVGMTYPMSALGHFYSIHASTYAIVPTPLALPEIAVRGFLRVYPDYLAWSGVLFPTGIVVHSVPVPVNPHLLGLQFGMQGFDAWPNPPVVDVWLTDNHLTLTVN